MHTQLSRCFSLYPQRHSFDYRTRRTVLILDNNCSQDKEDFRPLPGFCNGSLLNESNCVISAQPFQNHTSFCLGSQPRQDMHHQRRINLLTAKLQIPWQLNRGRLSRRRGKMCAIIISSVSSPAPVDCEFQCLFE